MKVVQAATVVLLRRISMKDNVTVLWPRHATMLEGPSAQSSHAMPSELSFSSGWQVLLGQSQVQNWVRSERGRPVAMRYGGEWKFPGGRQEVGEELEQTALRELAEEFGVQASDAMLHLFNQKRTKAVQEVRFEMNNFVCLADENPWLRELDPKAINRWLEEV